MATYPVLDQDFSSTRRAVNNIKTEIAADGTVRAQNNYSATVYQFVIVHPYIDSTEQASIQTFYNSNKSVSFTFNYSKDSADYTLIFLGEPEINKMTSDHWTVTTRAIGTAD